MDDTENVGGPYNKLVFEEELGTDEHTLYSNIERQQVSMSVVRPEYGLNQYRRLVVSLSVLAFILLAVDIGLGVYYRELSDGQKIFTDVGREVAKLRVTYNAAVQSRDEARNQLEKELSEQQLTKWELEHQDRRSKDYETQADKIEMEIAALKSHIPMIREGCKHCLPGWTLMNSMCYYFAFSDAMSPRSWQEARNFCKKQGSDLVVVNSRQIHLAINNLINKYQNPSRFMSYAGFWIGLRDVEEEGVWKWLDGTRLAEGYWNDGEPNNMGKEDCAATYPRGNPFKAWNDAPCNHHLKWICEMAPRLSS
ncbi:CD209 antigen-like [Anabas testudineus]|uniref:C-type lectin domain-containing protein n=1 Tax=Anabas testudineus TaxID=64144 RepID=A0A3Q1H2Z8_ANATE|nr:CD209 antigen-like [Anabas testudineus]